MVEGGSEDGASLSEEALLRGPRGGGVAPSLGTLEDVLWWQVKLVSKLSSMIQAKLNCVNVKIGVQIASNCKVN
jgi:hypothetical protein